MNQILYKDTVGNEIRLSQVTHFDGDIPFKGIGIKYVLSGEELYFVNKKKFRVGQGQYLLGNDYTTAAVKIKQKEPVVGLCIDISPQVIRELAAFNPSAHNDTLEFLLSDQLLVNRYLSINSSLGNMLQNFQPTAQEGFHPDKFLADDFFYGLAEALLSDQRWVHEKLNKINGKTSVTREAVFNALLQAKNYMDEHFHENPSLDRIVAEAGLSKYHFIRLFKATFSISPYRYMMRLRLAFAREQLSKGFSIPEIAVITGFSDTSAFIKAFKKEFLFTPGQVVKSNF
jgi:AraC family transcriptional regulator